jgi:Flp pilus assembly protein TadD
MKANLRLLTLLALISMLSLTGYSQSTTTVKRESTITKHSYVENTRGRTTSDDKKTETEDGAYWFNRGYTLHQSENFIEAIQAFTRAIGLRYRQATSMYNVACGYSLMNDKENALFWLDRSLGVGFDRADLLTKDSDLDPLRSDPRFKEILKKASLLIKKEGKVAKDEKVAKDKTVSRLEDAVNTYEQLKRDGSQDGDEWYKVGSRLLRLRDSDRAISALTQAVDYLGYRGSNAMYNLACAYALKGDRAPGIEWLEKSVNAGFDDSSKLRDDPDIANLRSEPRFKNIQELSRALSLSQFNQGGSDGSQYSKENWAQAVRHYEAFLKENPTNGRGWFNLGYALHYSREHSKAISAFEQAIQFGYRKPTSLYNIACGHSMMGNRDAAFEYLEKSVNAGFNVEGYILSDEDLANLRSDPRFKRYEQMAEREKKQKEK